MAKGGMETTQPPHAETVRRAALPEILFIPDIALALLASESTARRAVLRGDCGPYLRIGRRLAVRRDSFLEALETREIDPIRPRLVHRRDPGERKEP